MDAIVFVANDLGDWEGLYLNGELFSEGHRIDEADWRDLLLHLGVEVDFVYGVPMGDLNWGRLPTDIKDVRDTMSSKGT